MGCAFALGRVEVVARRFRVATDRVGARETLVVFAALGLSEGLGAIERVCAAWIVRLFVREEPPFTAFFPAFAALEAAAAEGRERVGLAALDAAFEPLDFAAGAFARDGGRREVRMREVMFRRKLSAMREAL